MTIEMQIRSEIYRALERLGADRKLLATVGSWGDTLTDDEVLTLLKQWNAPPGQRQRRRSLKRPGDHQAPDAGVTFVILWSRVARIGSVGTESEALEQNEKPEQLFREGNHVPARE